MPEDENLINAWETATRPDRSTNLPTIPESVALAENKRPGFSFKKLWGDITAKLPFRHKDKGDTSFVGTSATGTDTSTSTATPSADVEPVAVTSATTPEPTATPSESVNEEIPIIDDRNLYNKYRSKETKEIAIANDNRKRLKEEYENEPDPAEKLRKRFLYRDSLDEVARHLFGSRRSIFFLIYSAATANIFDDDFSDIANSYVDLIEDQLESKEIPVVEDPDNPGKMIKFKQDEKTFKGLYRELGTLDRIGPLVENISKLPENVRNFPIFGKTVGAIGAAGRAFSGGASAVGSIAGGVASGVGALGGGFGAAGRGAAELAGKIPKGKLAKGAWWIAKQPFTGDRWFFTGAGAFIRIGAGAAGLSGLGLSITSGATIGGLREHYKLSNQKWIEIKAKREGITKTEAEKLKYRMFSPKAFKVTAEGMIKSPFSRRGIGKIALGIGKGATFGAIGFGLGSFSSWFAENTGVGQQLGKIPGALADSGLGQGIKNFGSEVGKGAKGLEQNIRTIPAVGAVDKLVGESFQYSGNLVSEIYKTKGNLNWDKGSYIEPSKYMNGPLKIPDHAPDWLQYENIQDIHGEYAHEIQSAVGVEYSKKWDDILSIATDVAKQHGHTLSEEDQLNIMNNAMHIMEVHGNQAFDSHLEQVINGSKDLADASWLGNHDLDTWANSQDFVNSMRESADSYINLQNELHKSLSVNPTMFDRVDVSSTSKSLFEQLFPNTDPNDVEALRKMIPDMGAHIAANQDYLLISSIDHWKSAHGFSGSVISNNEFWETFNFPAYSVELDYLMERAKGGDVESLMRLKQALDIKLDRPPFRFIKLKSAAYDEILKRLKIFSK